MRNHTGQKKWVKWLDKNNESNKFLCSIISGHYVFSSSQYKRVFDELNKHEDFKEVLIEAITLQIDHYIKNFDSL